MATSICPPRGRAVTALATRLSSSLTLSLAIWPGDRAPDELVLALGHQAAADLLGGGKLDLGAGRAGGAEGEPGELQARGGLLGDIPYDVEGVGLGLGIVVLVEDLQAIVDGADGIDHVVADLAGDQGGELEIGRLGALGHAIDLWSCWAFRDAAGRSQERTPRWPTEALAHRCGLVTRFARSLPRPRTEERVATEERIVFSSLRAPRSHRMDRSDWWPIASAGANHEGWEAMHASEMTRLAEGLLGVALAAARVQMSYFGSGVAVERKADHSPVTAADRQSEEIILEGLARLAPGVPVIAEEAVTAGRIPGIADAFFLVDPLDGTNSFIKGRTVLHHQHRPHRGPAADVRPRLRPGARRLLCDAGARARRPMRGSSRRPRHAPWPRPASQPIRTRVPDPNALFALVSQSHLTRATERFLDGYNVIERRALCLLAQVRPHRPRRGRPLPARRPHQRMGHGRGPRRAGGGGRCGDDARRRAAPLRQCRARLRESRLRRLGARAAGAAPGLAAGIAHLPAAIGADAHQPCKFSRLGMARPRISPHSSGQAAILSDTNNRHRRKQ